MSTAKKQANCEKYSLPDKNQAIMAFPERCGLRMEKWEERGKDKRKSGEMQSIEMKKGWSKGGTAGIKVGMGPRWKLGER